jgi:hypothetical protein
MPQVHQEKGIARNKKRRLIKQELKKKSKYEIKISEEPSEEAIWRQKAEQCQKRIGHYKSLVTPKKDVRNIILRLSAKVLPWDYWLEAVYYVIRTAPLLGLAYHHSLLSMDNNLVTLVSYLNLQAMTFVARYISSE